MTDISPARKAGWAFAAALLVLAWQTATVHFNFGGNWSGLFYTGAHFGVPPELSREPVYLVPDGGWDGQFYHAIAHDPFLQSGLWKSIDAPRLRYRRILIPALAWLLALGNTSRIDLAYRAVVLAFVFLGVFWLSGVAAEFHRNPAWGLAFCALPATIISFDRMGVDIALMALCMGFFRQARKSTGGLPMFLILASAALSRETGFLLVAGWCMWLAYRRQPVRAAIYAASALPALAWYAYVQLHTPPYYGVPSIPFSGLVERFIHPLTYQSAPAVALLVTALDYAALLGVALAVLSIFLVFRKSGANAVTITMALFALLIGTGWHTGIWPDASDYARVGSPLLALLALRGMESADWRWTLPLAMVVPRAGIPIVAQAYHAVVGAQ